MRNTQATRYARWSAMISLVLTLLVVGVYLKHSWQAHLVRLAAPPPVPASVQEQSNAFTFSKESGDRTEFTVRASRATQFTQGGRGLLEEVWITAYGTDAQRFDNLHTRSCDYIDATGDITCAGDVQVDLESAADARLHPGTASHPNPEAQIVHVVTTDVCFNRKTGVATTDRSVRFQFAQMEGRAVGFHYDSGLGEMRLLQNVELIMNAGAARGTPRAAGQDAHEGHSVTNNAPLPEDGGSLRITGSSLIFSRDDRMLQLLGPTRTSDGAYELTAGQLDVTFDEQSRARRLVANGSPELHFSAPAGPISVSASEFSAAVSPAGAVQRMIATGNVHAREHTSAGDDRLDAGKADLEFAANSKQPRLLTATENVGVQSDRSAGVRRHLAAPRLEVTFAPAKKAGGRERADGSSVSIASLTAPAATIDSQEPADPANAGAADGAKIERVHLASQHLEATFGGSNQLQRLQGTGGTKLDRQIAQPDGTPQTPAETSTSREMLARFGDDGAWSSVDETGDVHLAEGESTAQSERAHFERLSDTVGLSGGVAISENGTRTTARSATFHRAANKFDADGRVVTSEMEVSNGAGAGRGTGITTGFGPGFARVSGDRLMADTLSGHAIYSGHARLWQGDAVIEADKIELDRPTQVIVASNHVRAVFPQAAGTDAQRVVPSDAVNSNAEVRSGNPKPMKAGNQSDFWHVEAGKMTYGSSEGHAKLEQGAKAHSNTGAIRGDSMDLFFAPIAAPTGSASAVSASGDTGRTGPTVTLAPSPNPGSPRMVSTTVQTRVAGEPGQAVGAQGTGRQLIRATAAGHVAIDQQDRHGTGDRGEYAAAEGKFVLSGGPPIVHDDLGNSTSGRELTWFLADDKILIDSASGVRTLTLHRVEK